MSKNSKNDIPKDVAKALANKGSTIHLVKSTNGKK